jgi:hypothetical protein
MKRNTLMLAGLFVILLIIAFLVLQKPGEQSANSASSGLMYIIDSLAVDKITIKTPASSLLLEKRGAEWFVAQPVNYRADQAAVGQIIHSVKNLEIKTVVSSKPDKQSVFQVDQTGTQVTLYEKGADKASFILGKMGGSYSESYVRRANSNDVITVEGASGDMFNRPVKDWRDKTILTVPKENIKTVQYQYGDTIFTVSFSDSVWVVGKEKVQQSAMEGLLTALSNVQADDFIDTTISPKITASISFAGAQLRFSFDKSASRYAVQSSTSPQWFVMEQWKANQLLKRKKDIVETAKK